jgi:nondiscriminating glutamyl-tRNA synthetase
MTQVRVRFAPSPTGYLHIGGARTALINHAFARGHDGVFVLRIEDTDIERSTEASFEAILTSLRWLGLDWDEGIEKGGDYGPYRQSECFDIYAREGQKLLDAGAAYYCYCSPDELEERRKQALADGGSPGYDGRCRSLSEQNRQRLSQQGRKPVLRFRVPEGRPVVVNDIVRGRVPFTTKVLNDFIILRADGRPTFHFANVVDDLRMRITHVIRGEDHLPNTPRHILLFEAFGAEPPLFAHISLIMGPDGARLSKRHGATAVGEFREAGYLPEALVNGLAMLGFAPPDEEEVFTPEEFGKNFDLATLGKSAAVFDRSKLEWFNGVYIRKMDAAELLELCRPRLLDAGYDLARYSAEAQALIIESIQDKMTLLTDCVAEASIYFEPIEKLIDPDALDYLKSNEGTKHVVSALAQEMAGRTSIAAEDIREIGKALQQATGAKGQALYMPVRIAVTGRLHGPELAKALPVLGPKECLSRIRTIEAIL